MGASPRVQLLALIFCVAVGAAGQTADPLQERVTIYRDDYGVPHIVGDSEEAAFFGYGYAQAEDHLERMMIQYRDAQGRRAEVEGFGALGDGYLQFLPYEYRWGGDYLQRLLRTKKAVEENRSKIDPRVYAILDAFARGVNAYIRENRASVPSWIEPIAAEDIEALERAHYFRFYSVHDALSKISDRTYSFPNLGSNQWAVAPSKSATGRVMHVEHTHMPWANRFQNYEAHLMAPGLNAGGISWFGSPFFLDGFNDRITWSATWNQPNIADAYIEKINPDNPLQYMYEGSWRDIRVEYETFRIKGPKGLESITLPLYYTHHGPIVRFDAARSVAHSIRLPNFESVNYSFGLYGLMKARDLNEFRQALGRQLIPRWNFLYSDVKNIYWVHNGNVAERSATADSRKPLPGWTKDTEWGAYLPFERYPQILNPPSGFLQNCNNPPWVATRNSGLRPLDPAPYYLASQPAADAGEEVLNTRGERIFEVLSQDRRFTLDDMIALGFDTRIMAAEVIVPLLTSAHSASGRSDPRVSRTIQLIREWDRTSHRDSVAYTLVHFWGKSYQKLHSNAKFARFNSYGRKQTDVNSSEEQRAALSALDDALAELERRYGTVEVPWGKINVVSRGGKFPLGGEGLYGVLHPDTGIETPEGEILCNDGWGHLMVVMEGSPKQIWTLLPYGQSERRDSPHYNDQAKLHSERKAKQFWFTAEDILSHSKSVRGDRDRIKRWMTNTSNEKSAP